MVDYRLHVITWKNVIDYNWLRLQIMITPCLVYTLKCILYWLCFCLVLHNVHVDISRQKQLLYVHWCIVPLLKHQRGAGFSWQIYMYSLAFLGTVTIVIFLYSFCWIFIIFNHVITYMYAYKDTETWYRRQIHT
jgi:hypothetical protein